MKEIIKMGMGWVDNEEDEGMKIGKMFTFGLISFFVLFFGMISIGIITTGFTEIAQAIMGYHPK